MDWITNYWAFLASFNQLVTIGIPMIVTLFVAAVVAENITPFTPTPLKVLGFVCPIIVGVWLHGVIAHELLHKPHPAKVAELANTLRSHPETRNIMAYAIQESGFNTQDHFSRWRLHKAKAIYDDMLDKHRAGDALDELGLSSPYAKKTSSSGHVIRSLLKAAQVDGQQVTTSQSTQ